MKLVYSMYKPETLSCACAYVSDFNYKDVKMFLLKFGQELQNLVEKFQSPMKI